MVRWGRRALLLILGFAAGWLLYQLGKGWIPFNIRQPLALATQILFALLALIFGERVPGRWGKRILQGWAWAAPVGMILLVFFQGWFVESISVDSAGSVILAASRLATCDCPEELSDALCVLEGTLSTESLARCWDRQALWRNRVLWSVAYLMLAGGIPAFLGLLWMGPGRAKRKRRKMPIDPAVARARTLFLSYSRADSEFAERLAQDLESRGIDVWWDRWDIDTGDSLPRVIEEAIAGSAWFGVVLSPDALASPWVRAELELARTLEIEGQTVVLPLLYRKCDVPVSLRQKAWAEFDESYADGLELLLRTLGVAPGD